MGTYANDAVDGCFEDACDFDEDFFTVPDVPFDEGRMNSRDALFGHGGDDMESLERETHYLISLL